MPEELYRVRVRVLDRPGVLSGITQALGAEGINIEDFELHHMSADAGGTAVIVVAGEGEARRAVDLLDAQGYGAVGDAGGRGMSDDGLRIGPAGGLTGELAMPGDKSVSHRAVLLGAISSGAVHVRGFGASANTLSTVAAVEALGVEVERTGESDLVVHGVGLRGFAPRRSRLTSATPER